MNIYRSKNAEKCILETYDRLLSMWGVETDENDVSTTFGTTHVIRFGSAGSPPLVLFHGVGDDSALMWLYNAKGLARHFSIFAVDTLGGPGKSRPNEKYDKNFDDAAWIDEVLDGLSLDSMSIAGVSHGAFLAQYYASRRPGRVKKIVCMAGGVPVGDAGPMKTMMKIFLPEALFPTKNNTVKLLQKLAGKNYGVFTDNPAVLEHYLYLLKGFNNMSMRFHKVESFTDAQIDSIRPKALYLMGDDDPFARLGGKDSLLNFRMNARFFPEVGHGINHEISDIINQQLIEYITG